jgi:hypothetical protein
MVSVTGSHSRAGNLQSVTCKMNLEVRKYKRHKICGAAEMYHEADAVPLPDLNNLFSQNQTDVMKTKAASLLMFLSAMQ